MKCLDRHCPSDLGDRMKLRTIAICLFILLLINTAYIAAFASPTVFYMGNVLLHLGGGLLFSVVFLAAFRDGGMFCRAMLVITTAAGLWLACFGNTMPHRTVLWAHILAGFL